MDIQIQFDTSRIGLQAKASSTNEIEIGNKKRRIRNWRRKISDAVPVLGFEPGIRVGFYDNEPWSTIAEHNTNIFSSSAMSMVRQIFGLEMTQMQKF